MGPNHFRQQGGRGNFLFSFFFACLFPRNSPPYRQGLLASLGRKCFPEVVQSTGRWLISSSHNGKKTVFCVENNFIVERSFHCSNCRCYRFYRSAVIRFWVRFPGFDLIVFTSMLPYTILPYAAGVISWLNVASVERHR